MFAREWKETIERKYALPDFSYKIVQIAINLLYGKKAVKECIILTPLNICTYLTVAFEKKFNDLVEYCIDYLIIWSQCGTAVKGLLSLSNEIKLLYADKKFKDDELQHDIAVDVCEIKIKNVPEEIQRLIDYDVEGDFPLYCENDQYNIHKALLNYFSKTFFQRLVSGGQINKFSSKIVQIAIDILYGHKCERAFTEEEFFSLYKFADAYGLQALKEAIEESKVITPSNVCQYLTVADEKKCGKIFEYLMDYLVDCFRNNINVKGISSLPIKIKLLYAEKKFRN
uniref:BTB domain-containing protein n=1 Tax=Panagrolaimus sp. ES5 TaxID=591445 RepID=A0AC34FBF5_9BILA